MFNDGDRTLAAAMFTKYLASCIPNWKEMLVSEKEEFQFMYIYIYSDVYINSGYTLYVQNKLRQ